MKYKIDFEIDLKRNSYKGLYLALEGTEASGKTTQVKELAKYFESKGKKVVNTREPRKEGLIGDLVHQILNGKIKMNPVGFQYLFAADRVLNHEDIVIPALKRGDIVISDRSFWSALVYGILDKSEEYSKGRIDELVVAYSILSFYHQFIVPDFTFYLKIPLAVSLGRLKNERNQAKEIYEEKEKIERVIKGYDFIFDQFKKEISVIDGTRSIKEVTSSMVKIIERK
jgi:dTMP kinase